MHCSLRLKPSGPSHVPHNRVAQSSLYADFAVGERRAHLHRGDSDCAQLLDEPVYLSQSTTRRESTVTAGTE